MKKLPPIETRFQPGHERKGGRAKGTRNKLTADFIAALCRRFEEEGEACLRIVVKEEPATFLKLIASVIPKELEINPNALAELTDDQLDIIARVLRSRSANDSASDRGGKEPTLN